jgi:predicted transcriptional regulator
MAEDERDFSRGRSEAELFGLLASSVSIMILEALRNVSGRTVAQISLETGESAIVIRRQVMAMQDLGLLRARVASHGVHCGAVDAGVYELLELATEMLAKAPHPLFDSDRHGDFAATSSSDA